MNKLLSLPKEIYLISDLLRTPRRKVLDNKTHIKEAVKWICSAQDATEDGGVSHSYHICRGWAPSYPETTGYIIPTLLTWSSLSNDLEVAKRAIEMADWEIDVQLEDGSVQGSVVGLQKKRPVVFNTGQVIFGWLSAYDYTHNTKYIEAAIKAAAWLIHNIDENHTWSTFGNHGTNNIHTYNARCAWAILALSLRLQKDNYETPMRLFLDWVLNQEVGRGWFKNNCLNDNEHPLLHTIAYTARGLLESGLILDQEKYIEASVRTSDELIKHISEDGNMPGRFDCNWRPFVKWSCLTGMAQMSIIWNKLYKKTGNIKYQEAFKKVNNFLKKTQDITSSNPGIRGGIKGSYAINGQYCSYRILNWATKFFIDALMLEEYPERKIGIL